MAEGSSKCSHRFLMLAGRIFILVFTILPASSSRAQFQSDPRLSSSAAKPTVDRKLPVNEEGELVRLPPVERTDVYRLADIESIALANNPSLARAAASVEAARGDWIQGGLYPNPRVGLGQQQTGSRGLAEQDNVTFSQEFVLGRKLRLNREVASHQLSQAQHEFAAQQLRVLTDVRIVFFHVLIAQQQRRLTSELVQIAGQGVEAAKRRDKANDIGENDVIEARIEMNRAEIEARKATNRHAASWRSLCAVSGVRDLKFQELEGEGQPQLVNRTWDGTLNAILRSSPEIGAAIANLERVRVSLTRAGVEKIPNITVDGLVNWRDNGIGGRPDGGFLVSVPLPVWDRNQGGVLRARSELAAAERAIAQLQSEIQNRLAPIFERYENADYQVKQYRDLILPGAAKALSLTRQNYAAGKVEYDDLLTSQRTNAQANIDYLDALRELWIADAELEGMTLSESLTANSGK